GILESGQSTHYAFTAGIILPPDKQPEYICARALLPNGTTDDNSLNDEICTTDREEFIFVNPYPNPVSENLFIEFIIPFSDQVDIQLFSADGKLVKKVFNAVATEGFNRIMLPVSDLLNGTYAIHITFNKLSEVRLFVKE
ncbi:MAG: T9SS type A sorting domain-containing protein, partial [Bacteroidetes bacterium]|nr:T9SS type A sorting domain-containing protein [Bacteroidota bacterium]